MIKYASNAFLATKISFANEIGNICKKLGIDSWKVFEGVGLDHRISSHFFKSGIGFGGSCFPKDVKALIRKAEEISEEPLILKSVIEVNERQPLKLIELLKKHVQDLKGETVGILGLAFKPNTDDTREARSIIIVRKLLEEGAKVVAYDPKAMENFKRLFPQIEYANSAQEVLERTNVILIVTEWQEFEELEYFEKIVIDGRRIKKSTRNGKNLRGGMLVKIRKAVIPAAGLGTRMLPITRAQPKEMVPVVHKPVIQYVVEEAYYSGIREILIITGKHKRAIEDHFDRSEIKKKNKYMEELDRILAEVDIFFVRQREQKGLGDAVKYAKPFVEDEPFALLLGDNITIPPCTKMLMDVFKKYRSSIIAVERVPKERIPYHGIIQGKEIEPSIYKIEDMIEKPKVEEAPSDIATLGRYVLTPEIFEYLERTKPGYGGEIQLTDALRDMAKDVAVYGYLYPGKRYDIGNKLEWLKANVELALEDKELGDSFIEWIKKVVIPSLNR